MPKLLSSLLTLALLTAARLSSSGHTIVTILCDSASRYAGKMFNREFLASKGLPTPDWIDPELPAELAEALARAKTSTE